MKKVLMHKPIYIVIAGVLFGCLAFSASTNGQIKYQSAGGVKIVIEGTSNIHDWNLRSDRGTCTAVFEANITGMPVSLTELRFAVPSESLKSEYKGMDKNTYKALNTTEFPSISFISGPATITSEGRTVYLLNAKGKLTISGVTKDVLLTANGVVNPDKSITYSGIYLLKMTDYNVKPPSIMLGTIKTGNNVKIKFNLVLKSI